MELTNENIPQSAEEAQSLMDSWETPEGEEVHEQEIDAGTEIAPGDGKQAVAPGQPAPEPSHNLNYKGKEESYPLSKIIEFAQQGRDYAQKMQLLNQQSTQYEQRVKAAEAKVVETASRYQQYAEIEAYQKQDPAWWDHVVKSYQEAKGSNAHAPSNFQLPPEIAKKIETLETFANQHTQKAEDTELDGVVTGYKGEFKEFDWKATDVQGRDLERQILDHAIELGFDKPSQFRIAANDYLFKQHAERARMNGKTEVAKQIQKTTKLGLGPVSTQPNAKKLQAKNVASKSYEQLAEEARIELGID